MTPHTPGPWTTTNGLHIVTVDGNTIARVYPARLPRVDPKQAAADARLIAAAPKMLVILEEALLDHAPCDFSECWHPEAALLVNLLRGVEV